jgi:hypothetical protein
MEWYPGVVVVGHGVASGRNKHDQFPGGALALQAPHFAARGLDITPYHGGTINVDLAPRCVELVRPHLTFPLVTWLEGYPAETFSFVHAAIRTEGGDYPAMVFYAHPETKPEHQQPPGVVELMAPFIPGIVPGLHLEVGLESAEMRAV